MDNNIDKLICLLIAIQNFAKDIHYAAKGDSFYSKHLLADRICNDIDQYLDQIKEIFFLPLKQQVPSSKQYLQQAIDLIPSIESNDKQNFAALAGLLFDTLQHIESLGSMTVGENNVIGGIAQDLQTNLGLINRQVEE